MTTTSPRRCLSVRGSSVPPSLSQFCCPRRPRSLTPPSQAQADAGRGQRDRAPAGGEGQRQGPRPGLREDADALDHADLPKAASSPSPSVSHPQGERRSSPAASPARGRDRQGHAQEGATGRAKLAYGTIIHVNVKGLSFAKTAFTGDPLDPKTLTLPASTRVKPGAILTGKPTDKLPAGVFHRVTKVKRVKRTLVVTVTPAHLQEAFRSGTSRPSWHRAGQDHGHGRRVRQDLSLDPLVASLGTPNFRCSFWLAHSYIRTGASLGLDGRSRSTSRRPGASRPASRTVAGADAPRRRLARHPAAQELN